MRVWLVLLFSLLAVPGYCEIESHRVRPRFGGMAVERDRGRHTQSTVHIRNYPTLTRTIELG